LPFILARRQDLDKGFLSLSGCFAKRKSAIV
jgi:hypothetical protein